MATIKPLDRLLFAQGGRCFFCNLELPRVNASIEHLVALANDGRKGDDNCVACCKALNTLLGSLSLKEKLRIFLNQEGAFRCPAEDKSDSADLSVNAAIENEAKSSAVIVPEIAITPIVKPATVAKPPEKIIGHYLKLVAHLKRGVARPNKASALRRSIPTLVGSPLSGPEIEKLVNKLLTNGVIKVVQDKITYLI